MAQVFRLPDIGEGLTEAEIIRWLVPVGEWVERDQPVVEVETAKAVVEIPCPFAGVVLYQAGDEGAVVAVGEVLLVVGDEGEQWSPEGEPTAIVGSIPLRAEGLPPAQAAVRDQPAGPGIQALPVVRKLARDLGVDLAGVEGSGPGGRITREDVERAAAERVPVPAVAERPVDPEESRRPMSRLRRTIAENLTRAWQEIPHVTTFDEVDASRLLAAHQALRERHGAPIPLDALLVKAVIPALVQYPEFRATLDGGDLVVHSQLHLGVAVDTEDGLMVAVVRDAARLSLLDLGAEVSRLAEGARQRTLEPAELVGQVFTVSNIGAVGGGLGTPIVPYGTTAILSCGRVEDRPVARQGTVEIAPMMPVALSFDHRAVDGALGRRFMAMVLENLAEPALFLA